jgi:hypothetical protein
MQPQSAQGNSIAAASCETCQLQRRQQQCITYKQYAKNQAAHGRQLMTNSAKPAANQRQTT